MLDIPPDVDSLLADFVADARMALREQLCAVVLFGSAAEGRLRATSDVNVLVVVSAFERERIDPLREPLRFAQAAVRLQTMFLLERELGAACIAFAEKFSDILRRRHVLHGIDPFVDLSVPRAALIARERQVLLNHLLRLRDAYLLRSLRAEQASHAIADASGPLRASAASLAYLRGSPATSPRQALADFVRELPGDWSAMLQDMTYARDGAWLNPDIAAAELFRMQDLAQALLVAFQDLD